MQFNQFGMMMIRFMKNPDVRWLLAIIVAVVTLSNTTVAISATCTSECGDPHAAVEFVGNTSSDRNDALIRTIAIKHDGKRFR